MTYQLRFYNDKLPPVLSNGFQDLKIDNYIIGSLNDPHWRLYPKEQFLSARNNYPIRYAFTDFDADENHFVFYMPENFGPTMDYSRLLRNYFETLHNYRVQYKREENQKILQERNEKVLQIKRLISENVKSLKSYKEKISKLKSARERAIRSKVRSGIIKKDAENLYDTNEPLYVNTANSIIILESNISTLKNELKNYID
jgi:hypothetical protein